MAGLDQRCVFGFFSGRYAGHALEEVADRNGVGGVVCPLVDDLKHVGFPDHAGGQLNTAGAPAVGHWHLAAAERYLVARNGNRFEDGAADHAFGLLIQIGKVVAA